MTKGCDLEKRCPACRFLKLQKMDKAPLVKSKKGYVFSGHGTRKGLLVCDETEVLNLYANKEYRSNKMMEFGLEDEVEREEIGMLIRCILREVLSIKEYEIISYYYAIHPIKDEHSCDEISKKMGLDVDRVIKIKEDAIKKLKTPRYGRQLHNIYNDIKLSNYLVASCKKRVN